jgi:hypothetical protein
MIMLENTGVSCEVTGLKVYVMNIRSVLLPTGLVVLCLLFVRMAGATTYHVDPSGSDINPGTTEQPFKSVAHAAAVVLAGDTVLVNPGIYQTR